jgi:hypothetical protein
MLGCPSHDVPPDDVLDRYVGMGTLMLERPGRPLLEPFPVKHGGPRADTERHIHEALRGLR